MANASEARAAQAENPTIVVGQPQKTVVATIAAGASLSDAVDLGDRRAVRIAWDAAWTPASVTFVVSFDGATWADLYDETGAEVVHQPVAGKSMRLPFGDWIGVRFVKIRSGTGAAPIAQAAARSMTFIAQ